MTAAEFKKKKREREREKKRFTLKKTPNKQAKNWNRNPS